jgi:hypothetical protein
VREPPGVICFRSKLESRWSDGSRGVTQSFIGCHRSRCELRVDRGSRRGIRWVSIGSRSGLHTVDTEKILWHVELVVMFGKAGGIYLPAEELGTGNAPYEAIEEALLVLARL